MLPFEATPEGLVQEKDAYIDAVIASLQSFFEIMPRGNNFVEFEQFAEAYETLRRETRGFEHFTPQSVLSAVRADPLAFVVLRSILGFTSPEMASVASKATEVEIDQGSARRIDKRARDRRDLFRRTSETTQGQVRALITAAVDLITSGAPALEPGVLHRLDKIDTKNGIRSLLQVSSEGVPYSALLYERFLGRPFATHRDAVSERVGSVLEDAVESRLASMRITRHKTAIAERFEDMDQAPDFFVPSPSHPAIIIEAKVAEDDGTARDKVTRVQHLAELRAQRVRRGEPAFEVIACVDGRGFGIRRERVWALLEATQGKLFTLKTMDRLIDSTSLRLFTGM